MDQLVNWIEERIQEPVTIVSQRPKGTTSLDCGKKTTSFWLYRKPSAKQIGCKYVLREKPELITDDGKKAKCLHLFLERNQAIPGSFIP